MWVVIFFASIAVGVGHAVYFSACMTRALGRVAPSLRPALRRVRVAYLVIACSLPTLLLAYGIYVAIARPESFGSFESTLFDYLVIYPFWITAIFSFQCTLLIVPLDLSHWIVKRFGLARSSQWQRRRDLLVLAIAAVFAVYVPGRLWIDSGSLDDRTHTIEVEGLGSGVTEVAVALLADPQADRYTGSERIGELVEATRQLEPALVLIAGDIITRAPEYTEIAARGLARLKAPLGVFSCVGDHENFSYRDRERSVREVREGLARHGISMLDNQVVTVPLADGATLALVFVTNNYVSRITRTKANELFAEGAKADVMIAIAHQTSAELLEDARAAGVDLFVAGHTHGGQIKFWLPFFDLAFVRMETPYLSGLYRVGDMPLVVSSGLGTSVAPLRYRAPATVDLIRLRAKPRPSD